MADPLGGSNVTIGFIVDPAAAVAANAAVADSLDLITASGVDSIATLGDFGDACDLASASSADLSAANMDTGASLDAVTASADTGVASFAELSASVDDTAVSMESMAAASDSAAASTSGATGAISFANDTFGGFLGSIQQVIVTLGLMAAAMAALTVIQDVSSWIEGLVQEMFSLDQTTQRTVNSWQYLFGSAAKGQQLAGWAYNESPNLPFTAMDLRGAVSTLGTAGYTPQQIEQFMPWLADIASTYGASAYGGQGVTLSQAANAIRMASFGLSRMLRTDLGVSPQDLIKYGLQGKVTSTGVHITNMQSLIPALEAWAQAHGLQGAAGEQETSTFWGAYSSFQDYMQNMMQTVGGLNPETGTVRKGSMFGVLQNALVSINGLLAQGQGGGANSIIGQLVGTGGDILGGLFSGGQSAIGGFLSGLMGGGGANVATDLFDKIKEFGTWLSSSDVQSKIHQLGQDFGEFMGQALKLAQQAMPDLVHAFQDLAKAAEQWWDSFTPAQQNSLKGFLGDIIEAGAGIVEFIAHLIDGVAAIQKFGTGLYTQFTQLGPEMKKWGEDLIQELIDGIESMLPSFGGLINNIAQAIANKLHFSKPDEGPLVDADQWMPDMLMMFASSLERGLPELENSVLKAAQTIANAFNGNGGLGAALTGVQGQTPYEQGQTFVDQFSRGAVTRMTTTTSPIAAAFNTLMTEVANQVMVQAVNTLNQSVLSATRVPGGTRQFGALGLALGGF